MGTCRLAERDTAEAERIEVSAQNECRKRKAQKTDSEIADILVTFGASVAFHKTYEQVVQFT